MVFDMKDLGERKQILGIEINRDMKDSKLWLLQQKCVQKVLMKVAMKK